MLKQVLLEGKPAYKISATRFLKRPKACCYICEGDEIWVPNSVCKYNGENSTLLVLDWFYRQNIEA